MNGAYDDIIHLPRHVSNTRPPMPMQDRAAQFSPFAALAGYDDAVRETARLTQERICLDEAALALLDRKLRRLSARLADAPEVTIVHFQPDGQKPGGAYRTTRGVVRRVDETARTLTLRSGVVLSLDNVLDLCWAEH